MPRYVFQCLVANLAAKVPGRSMAYAVLWDTGNGTHCAGDWSDCFFFAKLSYPMSFLDVADHSILIWIQSCATEVMGSLLICSLRRFKSLLGRAQIKDD